MTIRELLIDCSRKEPQEIFKLAVNATNELISFLENRGISDEGCINCVTDLFKLFVSADRSTTSAEYSLFLALSGIPQDKLSGDDFFEMTNNGSDPQFVARMKEFIQGLPQDIHYACCYLGVAIMCCDRKITDSEVTLLENLLD